MPGDAFLLGSIHAVRVRTPHQAVDETKVVGFHSEDTVVSLLTVRA